MPNNTIIFGDSYSTFAGFIPEGYAVYYSETPRPETDVTRVTETWWYQVMDNARLNLVLNNSWSGSTIGYTGYNNSDCSQSSSFIFRLRQLKEQGFFHENEINTVFVFGGTNDSWSDAPLGVSMPENQSEADLFSVLPAISHFLTDLKETLPAASIYCLINTELKPEIGEEMKAACKRLGIQAIPFTRIAKACGHPTVRGMQDIANQVLAVIR